MNTVEIKGVLYKKSALIAKQFGYTTDYVGQLCRAGKVNAQMVGRSWYVEPASVEAYRDQRYEDSSPSGEHSTVAHESVKKKVVHSVDHFSNMRRRQGFVLPQYVREFSYEKDEADILPPVRKPVVTLQDESTSVAIKKIPSLHAANDAVVLEQKNVRTLREEGVKQPKNMALKQADAATVVAARPFGKKKQQETLAFVHKNKLVIPADIELKKQDFRVSAAKKSTEVFEKKAKALATVKKSTISPWQNKALFFAVLAVFLLIVLLLLAGETTWSYQYGLPFVEQRFVVRFANIQDFFQYLSTLLVSR